MSTQITNDLLQRHHLAICTSLSLLKTNLREANTLGKLLQAVEEIKRKGNFALDENQIISFLNAEQWCEQHRLFRELVTAFETKISRNGLKRKSGVGSARLDLENLVKRFYEKEKEVVLEELSRPIQESELDGSGGGGDIPSLRPVPSIVSQAISIDRDNEVIPVLQVVAKSSLPNQSLQAYDTFSSFHAITRQFYKARPTSLPSGPSYLSYSQKQTMDLVERAITQGPEVVSEVITSVASSFVEDPRGSEFEAFGRLARSTISRNRQ